MAVEQTSQGKEKRRLVLGGQDIDQTSRRKRSKITATD